MARKKKTDKVKEPPVVFFLRIPEVEETQQPYEVSKYSEILETKEPYDHPSYSQILEVSENNIESRFTTDILKRILESVKKDSHSSDTVCFWCCHKFQGYQFSLPQYYDTYKNVYTCKGNFCSPECSLAYLYDDHTISDSTRWNKHII